MFKGLFSKDVRTANAEIERLTNEVTAKGKSLQEAQDKIAEYEKAIASFPIAKQDWDSQMETLKKEHQASIDALQKELEDTEKSVYREVAKTVSAIGIPEDEAFKDKGSSQENYQSALATLKTLKGSERVEFYKKNKGILTQPGNSQSKTVSE